MKYREKMDEGKNDFQISNHQKRRSEMRFSAWILVVFSIVLYAHAPNIRIEIEPGSIWVGDSSELTWDVRGADKVYISHIGKVPISGKKKISPENTTSYTLCAEGTSGIASQTVILKVESSRGNGNDFPDRNKFKYPLSYKSPTPSLVDFLDHIHNVLQDTMGFSLEEYEDHQGGFFVFITKKSQRSNLVQKNERRIGARRIAYLVEVKKPTSQSNNFSYAIKTLIDYRLRVERTWRPERDESIYHQVGRKLHEEINEIF
jgi:hypothetical protein